MARTAFVFIAVTLVLITLSTSVMASRQEVPRVLAGGYSKVSNASADARVRSAAEFALAELQTKEALKENTYGFKLDSSANYKITVVEAQQQVVAGLNYRLTILIEDVASESCVGAFKCLVYNRFGDLSVTRWGDEVPCDKAKAIVVETEKFESKNSGD